jgi:hypothetical protein
MTYLMAEQMMVSFDPGNAALLGATGSIYAR